MEDRVKNSIGIGKFLDDDNSKPLSPQILASIRSLIINLHTSESTLSSVLETLTRSLRLGGDSRSLHHTLKLLSDLSSHHPHLSDPILELLCSSSILSSESPILAAEFLSAISSITPSVIEIEDAEFASICFGQSVSVRLWLLRNAERFGVRKSVLLAVFLGFTRDPYPYVRKEALDGLVNLSKSGEIEERDVIEGCCCRAVELLQDTEDCVRAAAVIAVKEWGKLLVAFSEDNDKIAYSDAIFIQLCCMVRDMNLEVRLAAFHSLGEIRPVSENVLLQTLSKKVLGVMKEKNSYGCCPAEWLQVPASNAAGAFVHGLEDEFYEVRRSACYSLRTLTILSAKFAAEALNFLMDMLNDDSKFVRLQALETMHRMAICGHLNVAERHMHTFLGTLFDCTAFIRSATRKILRVIKLPKLDLFKQCVDGLLANLQTYPQDEVDIFSVLFYAGRNHGNFTVHIIKKVSEELEPAFGGKLGFDSAKVAAFLVLAISAPLSREKKADCISPSIFSYAATMLGRISKSLSDVMSQDALLLYLSKCSRSSDFSLEEFEREGLLLPAVEIDALPHTRFQNFSSIEVLLQHSDNEATDVRGSSKDSTSNAVSQQNELDDIRKFVNIIFGKVGDLWLLVQSGLATEALETFRACKEEVATFPKESPRSAGILAFAEQYICIVELLAQVWQHLVPTSKFRYHATGNLDILLGELDRRLRDIRSRFIGLSTEEELQILNLAIVACLLRLSKVEYCRSRTTMERLSSTISYVEFLREKESFEPSSFFAEVKKLSNGSTSTGSSFSRELLNSFSLKQFTLSTSPSYIEAELDIPGNDSENPLPFVSGLPVCIPLEVTLHNITTENRLWLSITASEASTQFVFLDFDLSEGENGFRKFTFTAPFYQTPKVASFTVRVSIGMECSFEDNIHVKCFGGPRHELTYISSEKEVYLSSRQ